MILTDSFVMLNFPRTGSTFVRSVLRRLYGPWWNVIGLHSTPRASSGFRELMLPIDRTAKAERLGRVSQHGRWGQIPAQYRHLPVVSVIRHPLDHTVSHYWHDDWWRSPPASEAALRHRYPLWPRLSFEEYLDFEQAFALPDVLKGARPPATIGNLTAHFVRFYARDPDACLAGLTEARIGSCDLARDLPPIRWLRHDRLADDLALFLREVGHSARRVSRACCQPPVNVSHSRLGRPWQRFYTPDLESLKRHRERLLFRLFPEFA